MNQFLESPNLINPLWLLSAAGVDQGYKVVDLGCGSVGHLVLPAARLVGQTGRVYAVDILRPALSSLESKAKFENLNNIEYIWADVESPGATGLADRSADVVLVKNVLFQCQDHDAVLTEALRLLRPEGRLVVVDWKATPAGFGPPLNLRVEKDRVCDICRRLKARTIQELDAGKFHYGVVFGR